MQNLHFAHLITLQSLALSLFVYFVGGQDSPMATISYDNINNDNKNITSQNY